MSAETNRDVTSSLAGFTGGLTLDALSGDVRERVKLLLLDALASALTGWSSPETSQVSSAVSSAFGSGETTVIGGHTGSVGGAVMLNGYLTTARSFCDIHQATLCHITPVVVPTTLAFAERADVDGATLLTALAAAMESNVRIGVGLDYPEFRSRGWHTPGVAGPLAAAIGAGRVLGFDQETIERAMGLAYSQAGGTFVSFGTPTIKFHQARAAWAGAIAALLAEQGFDGPLTSITASDGGMYGTFSNGGHPEAAVERLGDAWKLFEITVRLWPAAAALQSILTMIDENEYPASADIESVLVSLPPDNYEMNAEMGWETTFEATLSARYITSAALRSRGLWLDALEGDSLRDEAVGVFARERVKVARDDSLPEGGASLLVTMRSGKEIAARCDAPRGSPGYPATWDDVTRKFERAATARLDPGPIARVVELVGGLEGLGSVRELLKELRA